MYIIYVSWSQCNKYTFCFVVVGTEKMCTRVTLVTANPSCATT